MSLHHLFKYGCITFTLIFISMIWSCSKEEILRVSSPNGENVFTVLPKHVDDQTNGLGFEIIYRSERVLLPSNLDLTIDHIKFQGDWSVLEIEQNKVENTWTTRFGELSKVPDNYHELKISFKKGEAFINLIGRVYNEGVAFSYEIPEQSAVLAIELDEKIQYNFTKDHMLWSTPKREKGVLTAQGEYKKIPLSQIESGIERPLLIEISDTLKIALAEANLVDFARLSFSKGANSNYSILYSLDGTMKEEKQDSITGALVSERDNEVFNVIKKLPFQSPWRVVTMAKNEGELVENNYIIQNLSAPNQLKDDSWVIPGKA